MNPPDNSESSSTETFWVELPSALLSLLAEGGTRLLHFDLPERDTIIEVLLVRDGDGLTAVDTLCPHAGGRMEEDLAPNGMIRCPLHDLYFDIRTGKETDDACRPASVYPLRFTRTSLEIGLPREATYRAADD